MSPLSHLVARAACAALAALLPSAATAQVGHAPESSPYREIRYGSYLLALGGSFGGSGGSAGVGPHDGATGGVRWILLGNRPIALGLGLQYGDLGRLIQDPSKSPDTRTTGPVSQRVLFTDVAVQFNVTGGKSWRGLAPFTGAAAGLAFTERVAGDPSSYRTGTKLYFAPMLGTRVFLGQRLFLHVEGRFLFWQLKYPASFLTPSDPTETPILPGGPPSEWIATPWLQAGLGWKVSLPF